MPQRFFAFLCPCVLWLFLMREFVVGKISVNMDTNTIYGVTKFYFNNLLNGVLPLWEPFVALGRPFYALSICNLFNPIAQIIPLLKLLGVDYAHGFISYMVVYFFIGCWGFYLLALTLFKDRYLSYVAYIALMFSSLGASMFTQFTFLEMVVPSIWFFFFLLRFANKQTPSHFLGLSFSSMVLVSAYLPFYFMTVFLCFCTAYVALYFKETKFFFFNLYRFMLKSWRLVVFAFLGVLAAAGPLLAYKILDSSGEVVAPGRHCEYSTVEQCYERTMSKHGGMLDEEITRSGTLGERLDMQYLFGNLDKITYGSDSFFFLPVFIFILLALSLLLPLTRITIVLSVMGLLIALIASGNASGVHQFLYQHVSFFAYFRNLFFLGVFLIPIVILLAVHQLQMLFSMKVSSTSMKKALILGVLSVHAGALFFLKHYQGVPMASYITIGISAIGWVIFYSLGQSTMRIWKIILIILLLLQPVWILKTYAFHAQEFKAALPSMHVMPTFNWVRPLMPAANSSKIYQFVHYEDFWYDMSMTDAPPMVAYPQSVTRWVFDLSQHIPSAELAKYAQYKIMLFDIKGTEGMPVKAASPALSVDHFDVNSLSLHFNYPTPKILVYNDSYMSFWKATIDGLPVQLFRANGAFKAVEVAAGAHEIKFFYQPPGGIWVYILAAIALFIYMLLTLYSLRTDEKNSGL